MNANAKWIESYRHFDAIYHSSLATDFRREFELTDVPKTATLAISGVGFYDAQINGQPVTAHLLTPPYTAYDKRVYFEEYEVAALLKPGKNEIIVTLGAGWYAQTAPDAWEFEHATWRSPLQMIASLTADGECVLATDSSWQSRDSKLIFSQLREGETYDNSRSEAEWKSARVSRGPGGLLEKYDGPAIEIEEILEPVSSHRVSDGVVYDFGVNLSGNCEITVIGAGGYKVTMQYGERLTDKGDLEMGNISSLVYSSRIQTDEYIIGGGKEESWHSKFTYNGFRYVKVYTQARIVSIRARNYHTTLPEVGGFECDNELINQIQAACLRATKTNFHHMPTDCPHREKNGWTGDAHLSCEQALFNLDIAPAYRKWLKDMHDAQRPNGALPGVLPTSIWGYNWGNGISWDCVAIVIPWQAYMATGDESFLRDNFDMMDKYMDYMTSLTENHISTIGLGDWCPSKGAKQMNTPALLTAISIRMYEIMEKVCKITGLGDADKYAALAAETRKVFTETFVGEITDEIRAEKKALVEKKIAGREVSAEVREAIERDVLDTYIGKCEDSQTFLAMLLWFDLTDDREGVAARLAKEVEAANDHLQGGIFCTKFLFDALTDNGYFDLAYKIATQTDAPSYGHMLSNGSGTLWEDFAGENSLNHHMFSPISAWFFKGIAGIRIEEAGYKKVRIEPHIPADMHYFRAWHNTPYGKLEVLWKDGKLTVSAPCEVCVMTSEV